MAQLQEASEALDRWEDSESQRSVLALRDTAASSLLFPEAPPHTIHLFLILLLQKQAFSGALVSALLS